MKSLHILLITISLCTGTRNEANSSSQCKQPQATQRYNIAWVCPETHRSQFLTLASDLFAQSHDGYLLSKKSLPHVSICQFECDDTNKIAAIRDDLQKAAAKIVFKFTGLACLPGEGEFAGSTWAELSVLRRQELIDAQSTLTALLQKHGVTTLNAAGSVYRPHATLAKISSTASTIVECSRLAKEVAQLNQKSIQFKLALGKADKNWQFVEEIQ